MNAEPASTWNVAPQDYARLADWLRCRELWLLSKERRSGRTNTVVAYARDWDQFFGAFGDWCEPGGDGRGLAPWQVSRTHVELWLQDLQESGLAGSTIVRKLAALSSFYKFAREQFFTPDPVRGDVPLWDRPNPFRGHDLPKEQARPVFPSTEEVRAILNQIEVDSAVGLRNMAVLFGLFATTRRVSEWLGLRWGDVHGEQGNYWFAYRYKSGKLERQALPGDVYDLIVLYLRAARRWPLDRGAFVFVALDDSGARFATVDNRYDPAQQPLSTSYVWRLLRRYGALAGIDDPRKLHPHGLRHAGARFRKEAGADTWELQQTLGHANLAITERYTRTVLEVPQDRFAETIGDLLPRAARYVFKSHEVERTASER